MNGACSLSALIYCNSSTVYFPGLSFALKYRLFSNCFIQKLKSIQQMNTSPNSSKPRRNEKCFKHLHQYREKWKWDCLTHKGIMEIDSFIYLSEKISQKSTNKCTKHEVFCLLPFLIQFIKSNISKL